MENEIFTQPQEKLSDDAWKILNKVSRKDAANARRNPRLIHSSGNGAKRGLGSGITMSESSGPLFMIKQFFRKLSNSIKLSGKTKKP